MFYRRGRNVTPTLVPGPVGLASSCENVATCRQMSYKPPPIVRLLVEPFDGLASARWRTLRAINVASSRGVGTSFTKWDGLCTEISHRIRAHDAILDGEIVCLDADGRSNFHQLMFRRDWPYFYAFDLLAGGEDLTGNPLIERKRRLRNIMPRVQSRLLYVDHLERRGCGLYHAACERDLEGIVGKWAKGSSTQMAFGHRGSR